MHLSNIQSTSHALHQQHVLARHAHMAAGEDEARKQREHLEMVMRMQHTTNLAQQQKQQQQNSLVRQQQQQNQERFAQARLSAQRAHPGPPVTAPAPRNQLTNAGI